MLFSELIFELITLTPRWLRGYLLVICFLWGPLWGLLWLLLQPLCGSFIHVLLFILCGAAILILAAYYANKWRELGLRYAEQAKGDARDSHAVKAAKYFMKSSLLNLLLPEEVGGDVLINLGLCYACGFGVEKNPQKATKCYHVAARGSTIAQLALGLCYADGIGVETDKIKAEDLLSKVEVPSVYLRRCWNKNEVLTWLRVAGERGNASVQMALGEYYHAANDYAEAVKWFRKVAEAEHDYSALYDFSFWGRKKRVDAVRKLYDKVTSYMYLARIYLRGDNGVKNDAVEAVQCLKTVAESELGDFVISNPKHYSFGTRYSIQISYLDAQTKLGECYLDGTGVGKDEAEAVKWFRKAAEQGNASAQIFLADCYLFGRGVARDEAEALVWFRRAAKQDGYDAETAKNYLKAVEDGDPESQYNLAIDYLFGWRIKKNEAEAFKWFRKAAEQGYESAIAQLEELTKDSAEKNDKA